MSHVRVNPIPDLCDSPVESEGEEEPKKPLDPKQAWLEEEIGIENDSGVRFSSEDRDLEEQPVDKSMVYSEEDESEEDSTEEVAEDFDEEAMYAAVKQVCPSFGDILPDDPAFEDTVMTLFEQVFGDEGEAVSGRKFIRLLKMIAQFCDGNCVTVHMRMALKDARIAVEDGDGELSGEDAWPEFLKAMRQGFSEGQVEGQKVLCDDKAMEEAEAELDRLELLDD